jgi:hypothetical protein
MVVEDYLLQYFSWCCRGQILLVEYLGETTDPLHIADNLYHIMLYQVHHATGWYQTNTFIDDKHWLFR